MINKFITCVLCLAFVYTILKMVFDYFKGGSIEVEKKGKESEHTNSRIAVILAILAIISDKIVPKLENDSHKETHNIVDTIFAETDPNRPKQSVNKDISQERKSVYSNLNPENRDQNTPSEQLQDKEKNTMKVPENPVISITPENNASKASHERIGPPPNQVNDYLSNTNIENNPNQNEVTVLCFNENGTISKEIESVFIGFFQTNNWRVYQNIFSERFFAEGGFQELSTGYSGKVSSSELAKHLDYLCLVTVTKNHSKDERFDLKNTHYQVVGKIIGTNGEVFKSISASSIGGGSNEVQSLQVAITHLKKELVRKVQL